MQSVEYLFVSNIKHQLLTKLLITLYVGCSIPELVFVAEDNFGESGKFDWFGGGDKAG